MEADIRLMFDSPEYSIRDFRCRCTSCGVSGKEHQEHFSIAYIRKGNFRFNVFRNELDAYSGLFLFCKPGYEHTVGHVHDLPDECTIFSFSVAHAALLESQAPGLKGFFRNPDLHSILVKATPDMEYLHHRILTLLERPRFPQMEAEQLMADLFGRLMNNADKGPAPFSGREIRHYMPLVEAVKIHISTHFDEDLSLNALAAMSHMSPYHFNRMFRQMTHTTPYRYLLNVRLQEAAWQLRHTGRPVTEIAFATGFHSLEHFSAAFRKVFGKPPSGARA